MERPITLDEIAPKNYNNLRPPIQNGKAAEVRIRIYVLNVRAFDDSEMTFGCDIFMQQYWKDHRLKFPPWVNETKLVLNVKWIDNIWVPDLYFQDTVESTVEKLIRPNLYLWLHRNNTVSLYGRFTFKVSCDMDLRDFPHDTQICGLKIMSISYTHNEMDIRWLEPDGFRLGIHIVLPQFEILSINSTSEVKSFAFGDVSYLTADMTFKRREGYFVINVYIPTILIVMMSMLTFWVPPDAVPARVTLGVTSLLTVITKQYQADTPNVSYIVALNVWLSCCIAFVFCSLLEYAVIIALVTKFKRKEEETKNLSEKIKCDVKVRAFYVRGTIKAQVADPKEKEGLTLLKVAHFIDQVSRVLFPLVFVLMAIIYWRYYCST